MPPKRIDIDAKMKSKKHTEEEMHRFVREISSSKCFKGVTVKNQQAKRALDERGKKIEVESRLAAEKITKKKKELIDQLQLLKTEKENIALRKLREKQVSRQSMRGTDTEGEEDEDDGIVNPYPINFNPHPFHERVDKLGMDYLRSQRGRRRQSHEFEDLNINTTTGALLPNIKQLNWPGSRLMLANRTPSYQNFLGNQARDWPGHPDAISSVRRSRKTAEQLQKDSLLNKISHRSKTAPKKPLDKCETKRLSSPSLGKRNVKTSKECDKVENLSRPSSAKAQLSPLRARSKSNMFPMAKSTNEDDLQLIDLIEKN